MVCAPPQESEAFMAVQRAGPDPDHDSLPAHDAPIRASASFCVTATATSVGPVRRAVANFAYGHGASALALESVSLAVSEALTNVVLHAYRDAPAPGPVLVVAAVRDGRLTV